MKSWFFKPVVAAVALLGVAACAQPETPEDKYYRLQITTPAATAQPVLSGTLQVDRFLVDGLVGRSQIVYVQDGQSHELQTYHYHHWTEPPAVLLQDQLISYLRGAHIAAHVVSPEMRVDVDHVLTGRVKRLEQVRGTQPKAIVQLEVGVRRTSDGKLLVLRDEVAEAVAASDSVSDGVAAMNRAVADLFSKLVAALKSPQ